MDRPTDRSDKPDKPGRSRHYPEQTTLSLPNTRSLQRVIEHAEAFTTLAGHYKGGTTWTEDDKEEAGRLLDAQRIGRMWERRRQEVAQAQLNRPADQSTSQPGVVPGGDAARKVNQPSHYQSKHKPTRK